MPKIMKKEKGQKKELLLKITRQKILETKKDEMLVRVHRRTMKMKLKFEEKKEEIESNDSTKKLQIQKKKVECEKNQLDRSTNLTITKEADRSSPIPKKYGSKAKRNEKEVDDKNDDNGSKDKDGKPTKPEGRRNRRSSSWNQMK